MDHQKKFRVQTLSRNYRGLARWQTRDMFWHEDEARSLVAHLLMVLDRDKERIHSDVRIVLGSTLVAEWRDGATEPREDGDSLEARISRLEQIVSKLEKLEGPR